LQSITDIEGQVETGRTSSVKPLPSAGVSAAYAMGLPASVSAVLHGSGQPLDPTTRAWMESRFGYDFKPVRVHYDARAASSAQAVNAAAYTVGRDIVFGAGRYAPTTAAGLGLLAHELAHTIQQRPSKRDVPALSSGSSAERAANRAAQSVMNGQTIVLSSTTGVGMARQPVTESIEQRATHPLLQEIATVTHHLRSLRGLSEAERRSIAQYLQELLAEFKKDFVGPLSPPDARIIDEAQKEVWANPSDLWLKVNADFTKLMVEIARINQMYPTPTRKAWNESILKQAARVGAPGERSEAEIKELERSAENSRRTFQERSDEAQDQWIEVIDQYFVESERLVELGDPEILDAIAILDREFNATMKRVVFVGDFLVPEDLAHLKYMLENKTHIAQAERQYLQEKEQIERQIEQFERESKVEEPGVASMVWSVVGWESGGEFAADVALTVLTGGVGKVARILGKGAKAVRRAKALQRLAKLRRARRLQRLGKGIETLLGAADKVLLGVADDVRSYMDFVKKNWRPIAGKIATDLTGRTVAGNLESVGATALGRINKEFIASTVESQFRMDKKEEAEVLKMARIAFVLGQPGLGRRALRRYFILNFKRRLLTNVIYYMLGRVARGQVPTKKTLADIATATGAEMGQDFVMNLGAPALLEKPVEAARKSLQQKMHKWIEDSSGW
jgi:hypothetical protein